MLRLYFFGSEYLYWGLGGFLTTKFPRLQNREPCSKLQYGNDHVSVCTDSNIIVYLSCYKTNGSIFSSAF